MKELYCGPISFEYMHIGSAEKKQWIRTKVEQIPQIQKTKAEKLYLLDRVLESETFTNVCDTKFPTAKRFGIEGCDSAISGLEMMCDHAKTLGTNNVILGMAHRGRLNTLACVFDKPYEQIFGEFKDVKNSKVVEDDHAHSGDVKYHLGATNHRMYSDGGMCHLTMLPNPSHLETVNTVAMGKARSKMDQLGDKVGDKVISCCIHGDAAIAGQGIVYEHINMEKLRNYQVGGTIHVVFNNQVGFTTNTRDSRSTHYCTDVAKTLNAFVIHVNAQNPEYVDWAFQLAVEYNLKFKRDVFVDVIGYRKFGHNEQDMPQFTQPIMYKKIAEITPMWKLYCDQLIGEGVVTQGEIDKKIAVYKDTMFAAFDKAGTENLDLKEWDSTTWKQMLHNTGDSITHSRTGVSREKLLAINEKINVLPSGYNFHKNIRKVYEGRHKAMTTNTGIGWDLGEQMAYATLLEEGFSLRLSGEDVERGTFAHRHARIYDQDVDGKSWTPLQQCVNEELGHPDHKVNLCNSHLSEYGILGFEYGYSLGSPNSLTIWEAQFGDFANVAQATIDTFVAAGERKWGVKSGLVLLLPHGYDGNGPEHSSARLERFLQLMDDDPYSENLKRDEDVHFSRTLWSANMSVVNCTTPANIFHALRRQMHRDYRKPMIVMSPKKLLRSKNVKYFFLKEKDGF
jgi:2-oxoglutarate dehydrogenase E1 component